MYHSETVVNFGDLPDWVRAEVSRVMPRKKPEAVIVITEQVSFGSVWHDAARRHVIARNKYGEIMRTKSGYYDSYVNMSAAERATYHGGNITMTPDRTVVEILTYPRRVTMFLHPDNAPKLLAEQEDALPEDQYAVLCVLISHTSAGRKDVWQRYRVSQSWLDKRLQALKDRGMISIAKNGAVRVTIKGKNSRKGIDSGTSFFYNCKHKS